LGASETSNIVTFWTDGANGFSAGDPVVISGVGSGYDGDYTIASASTQSFTVNFGAVTGLPTVGKVNGTTGGSGFNGVAVDTNDSGGLLINGTANQNVTGDAAHNSQRSMVDTIVYKFNQAVNLAQAGVADGDAFTITGIGGANAGTPPTWQYSSPDGGFTWVVTFSGSSVTASSIANGEYQIVLNSTAVTAVYSSDTLAASDTETFYRLFGDTIGDSHYRVNATDYGIFSGAYQAQATGATAASFLAYLDFNDDGRVNATDYGDFSGDYQTHYSGFTATI
jgi:hypothetical protein